MATKSDQQAEDNGAGHATGTRAVIAAAATGAAAAYGLQRLRAGHEDGGAEDESGATADQPDDDGGAGKREALTHALSTKVAQAKERCRQIHAHRPPPLDPQHRLGSSI